MIYVTFKESHRDLKTQKIPDMFPISNHVKMPAEYLQKNGAKIMFNEDFFQDEFLKTVKKEDILIVWIGLDNDSQIRKIKNLKCRKILRNIDVAKVDKVLFKSEINLFEDNCFDEILLCYPSLKHASFLKERKIDSISYPHLLDFKNRKDYKSISKKCDIIGTGQMAEASYPVRYKILNMLCNKENIESLKYTIQYLPHPGWGSSKSSMRHNFINNKYIEFLSEYKMGITCSGNLDSMYMKHLEMAMAYTLPIGENISYMPKDAKDSMIIYDRFKSDRDFILEVNRVLKNQKELDERTMTYSNKMSEFFEIEEGTKAVIKRIKNREYIC